MKTQFKMVRYGKPIPGQAGDASGLGFLSRFKLSLVGVLVAALALGVLAIALVIGSVLAAVVCSTLILVCLVIFLKAAFRQRG